MGAMNDYSAMLYVAEDVWFSDTMTARDAFEFSSQTYDENTWGDL